MYIYMYMYMYINFSNDCQSENDDSIDCCSYPLRLYYYLKLYTHYVSRIQSEICVSINTMYIYFNVISKLCIAQKDLFVWYGNV